MSGRRCASVAVTNARRPERPGLFADEFRHASARIAVFPESGIVHGPATTPVRYMLLPSSRYRVYYRIDEVRARVSIVAVRSGRRGTQPRF